MKKAKANKEKKEKRNKVEHKYVFPNFLASAMKNANIKTQLEASMMSMIMLLLGMILMGTFSVIYLQQGWIFKGLLIFNIVAGFLFMSSYLVTTYQQYSSYLAAVEVQKSMDTNTNQDDTKPKKNRLNQFLFFGGLLLLMGGVAFYFFIPNEYNDYANIGLVAAVIGFLMILAVFRPRKDKKKKDDNKTKVEVDTKPEDLGDLESQWSQDIDGITQQNEFDDIESEADQYMDNAIQQPQPQNKYYSEQPKRTFVGKDGRVYYV